MSGILFSSTIDYRYLRQNWLEITSVNCRKGMGHSKSPQVKLANGRAFTSCTSRLPSPTTLGGHILLISATAPSKASAKAGSTFCLHFTAASITSQPRILGGPWRSTSLVVGLQGGDVIGLCNSSHRPKAPPHWQRGSWGRSQASPAGTCSTRTSGHGAQGIEEATSSSRSCWHAPPASLARNNRYQCPILEPATANRPGFSPWC